MRIVLDTNVLVSAANSPQGTAARILLLAAEKKARLLVSPFILSELAEVLARPKIGFSPDKIHATIGMVKEIAEIIEPIKRINVIETDEADNRVLECAVDGKADVLVTGDLHHIRPLGKFGGIEILTPREFLDRHFPAT